MITYRLTANQQHGKYTLYAAEFILVIAEHTDNPLEWQIDEVYCVGKYAGASVPVQLTTDHHLFKLACLAALNSPEHRERIGCLWRNHLAGAGADAVPA